MNDALENRSRVWMSPCSVMRMLGFVIAIVCSNADKSVLGADKPTQEMLLVEQLQERRLFRIANALCERELEQSVNDANLLTHWTVLAVQTKTSEGLIQSGEQRSETWAVAEKLARDYLAVNEKEPRAILVQVQLGLCQLTQGEALALEYTLSARPSNEQKELALVRLRGASSTFDDVNELIKLTLPKVSREDEKELPLTPDELRAIQRNLLLYQAKASKQKATLFGEPEELDRVNSLQTARDSLITLLTQTSPETAEWWFAELEFLDCLVELGDYAEAQKQLENATKQSGSSQRIGDLLAVQIRLALLTKKIVLAKELGTKVLEKPGPRPPRLDLAVLDVLLNAGAEATEKEEQERWTNQAVAYAKEIESSHGAFWGRRANQKLLNSGRGKTASSNLELTVQVAEEAFQQQRYDDAINAYQKAAELAQKNNPEFAFELLRKEAAVEQARGEYGLAAEKFCKLAIENADHEKAAETHWFGVLNFAQTAQVNPEEVSVYHTRLREHVAKWGKAGTSNQARLILANVELQNQRYIEGVELLLGVDLDSPEFGKLVVGTEAVIGLLERNAKSDSERKTNLRRVVELIETKLKQVADGGEQDSNGARHILTNIWGRLLVLKLNEREQDVVKALSAFAEASNATSEQSTQTKLILLASYAAIPEERAKASALAGELSEGDPGQVIELLNSLRNTGSTGSAEARKQLAEIQLELVRQIKPNSQTLTLGQQIDLSWAEAWSLLETGKVAEGIAIAKSTASTHPKSGSIQEELGVFLSRCGKEHATEAVEQWRRITAGSKPNSERWIRAKYFTAKALVESGDKVRAKQMLLFMKETPPGWEASPMRQDFEQLLNSLK